MGTGLPSSAGPLDVPARAYAIASPPVDVTREDAMITPVFVDDVVMTLK